MGGHYRILAEIRQRMLADLEMSGLVDRDVLSLDAEVGMDEVAIVVHLVDGSTRRYSATIEIVAPNLH